MIYKVKRLCTFLCIFGLLFFLVPSNVSSEEASTRVIINPMAPQITEVYLMDSEFNIKDCLDVDREYLLKMNILDKNGLYDINGINVKVFYAKDGNLLPNDNNKRYCYEINWINNMGQYIWNSSPAGYVLPNNCSCKQLTPYKTSITFSFKLDKIAVPSGSQNTWKISIEVDDRNGMSYQYNDTFFDVNDYIEWSGIPSVMSLSSVNKDPESPWILESPQVINVNVTSNTEVDISFQAMDLVQDGIVIDASSYFSVQANNSPSGGDILDGYEALKPVPETCTVIYQNAYDNSCALNSTVDGYIDNNNEMISFIIDVQGGKNVPCVPAGTYIASWYFSIMRGEGSTL